MIIQFLQLAENNNIVDKEAKGQRLSQKHPNVTSEKKDLNVITLTLNEGVFV